MFYRKFVQPIEYKPALDEFRTFSEQVPGVLLESVDIAPIYGRKSLFFVDPVLEVKGSGEQLSLTPLHSAGEIVLQQLTQPVTHLRQLFEQIKTDDPYCGLYGAFSYDFVRQFETLPNKHPVGNVPDFQLYFPDLVFVYDHLKETAELHYYQLTNQTLAERLASLPRAEQSLGFQVGELTPNLNQAEYLAAVERAHQHMAVGDIFEIVLSRKFSGAFSGSALGLYAQYRQANPSPYMFFIRNAEATLLAASPEMLVRVESAGNNEREVMTRPISGTAARSQDAITDYEQMLNLLNSTKEKSELDMLIDLARNDLARVCQPGIQVSDYRYVEKYSKVMHTIAQVTGKLETNQLAFDALAACLNAGTLTGAPKIKAMELIEELEPSRRGYYGGCAGYITFNNELNTGITIRSAVIADGTVTTQAGATILLDSKPEAEFQETEQKASALLGVLTQS